MIIPRRHLYLLAHDQRYGGRRLITQRARRASHGDGVGAGLGALLLATPTATATSSAIASAPTARWEQECEQRQSEQRSGQGEACALSPLSSGSQQRQPR